VSSLFSVGLLFFKIVNSGCYTQKSIDPTDQKLALYYLKIWRNDRKRVMKREVFGQHKMCDKSFTKLEAPIFWPGFFPGQTVLT
jgi:hypothetical protein